ncbi:MAG: 50S ribosomal protein L15 [Vicinamibacteria bacterium]|nr:50S ribosomal protein L15 [Vicinamibacteria bacterium]
MSLNKLKPAKGSIKNRKRVGRGPGSGLGKTSGRGEKGQKSRSGYSHKVGFEGGQMPLHRRVPKRGFNNLFRREFSYVNLGQLECFDPGTIVTPDVMLARGLVSRIRDGVKILGNGDLSRSLTVRAHRFSARAQERISAAGGRVELIEMGRSRQG